MHKILQGRQFLHWAWREGSLRPAVERAGFWFVAQLSRANVFESRDFVMVPTERMLRQTQRGVVPDPLCLVWACRHARSTGTTLFLLHTHVAEDAVFSLVDEAAERRMAPRVMALSGSRYFGAVVAAPGTYCARLWQVDAGELTPTAVDIRA